MSNVHNMDGNKMNGAMRLFEALSGVDEKLLVNSEKEVRSSFYIRRGQRQKITRFTRGGAVLAAAVCVLAVGIGVWQMSGPMFVAKDSASCAEAPAEMQEAMPEVVIKENATEVPEAATGAVEELKAEKYEADREEQEISQSTDGTTEDVKVTENGKVEKGVQEKQQVGAESLSEYCIDSGAPLDNRKDITEAQARELTVLGAYVPSMLPTGYTWESGKYSAAIDREAESVSLAWTKGMDYIEIIITKVDAADIQLTDITAEETYNVHLYDIPYAETLPKEYRTIFDNPVFEAEDLSLELIEKRMKTIADAGDTATPRGNFSVLYEEGVLVKFGGRGTAQEIWEMFQSIK